MLDPKAPAPTRAITIPAFLLSLTLAASAQIPSVPDGLYLRFNEGVGNAVRNEAYPRTIGTTILQSVAAWMPPSEQAYLGGSAYQPNPSGVANMLTTGGPYSFTPSWTLEFALATPLQGATSTTPILNDSSINLSIVANPRAGGAWEINGLLPVTGLFAGVVTFTSSIFAPTKPWTFVSVVHDAPAAELRIYVDGTLRAVNSYFSGVSVFVSSFSPTGLAIGGSPILQPPYFTTAQAIDEMRIWNRARTAAEIFSSLDHELIPDVRGFVMAPGGVILLDPQTATFTAAATIAGLRLADGYVVTDPGFDPAIGAPVSGSGNYANSGSLSISDIMLTPATIVLSGGAPGDSLAVTGVLSANAAESVFFAFGGDSGALPVARRALHMPPLPSLARTGSGSAALDAFGAHLASGSTLALLLCAGGNAPNLLEVAVDFQPPTPAPARAVTTSAPGAFALGLFGLPAGVEIANLFQIPAPNTAVGAGAFFGLVPGPDLDAQIGVPVPTQPFRVTADSMGTYYFGLPGGSLPPGITVDAVSIAFTTSPLALVYQSGVARLTF